ncbi:hypothetical protein [Roseateles cavernae]|uniref:hypothetical protein n=1 Tax=Roseateles cavernae TaxID=3153578 RepID=UPI0032E509C3
MPTRLSHPGAEPVTVAAAKLAASIDADITAWDTDIAGLISAARESAEHMTGRTYRRTVWREELADWPAVTDAIRVHGASACAISYWTGSAWATLDAAAYVYAPGGIGNVGTCVAPSLAAGSWPALGAVALGPRVRVDITAGPPVPEEGQPVVVPAQVDRYIKAHVSAWRKNPEATASASLAANPLLASLLDAEKLWV